jgi:superfamily II DNA or RNA helicase
MAEAFRYPFEDVVPLHDYQRASVKVAEGLGITHKQPRLALYYKTGAGKTRTALACLKVMGQTQALVIAPPTTHTMWQETGEKLGITVVTWSHQKFRKPEHKVSKSEAIIVDEFHMLGGYKAQGFKKLEKIAASLPAPIIIASATPNYNDVERCYCIQRITDRRSTEGGYLSFIYKHCATDVNPWGHVPRVSGFLHYPDAASFLADLPNVEYIEDDLVYDIEDEHMVLSVPPELLTIGLDRRRERMIGSGIEMKHSLVSHMLVTDKNFLTEEVTELLVKAINDAPTPVLVFAVHTQVAHAAARTLVDCGYIATAVTGTTTKFQKDEVIETFKAGRLHALVGTQTLATGTDGLDKMCDVLVILDDTEDNAMRRQLIGRIMPRGGATTEAHTNRVIRVVPEPSPGP